MKRVLPMLVLLLPFGCANEQPPVVSATATITAPVPAPPSSATPAAQREAYPAELGGFFAPRLTLPSAISAADERALCVSYQISVNEKMVVWHVKANPVKTSGNKLFDDAAGAMLVKLLDDRTPLPDPPPALDAQYRGRQLHVAIVGRNGDPASCGASTPL